MAKIRQAGAWADRRHYVRSPGGVWVERVPPAPVGFIDPFDEPIADRWNVSSGVTQSGGQVIISTSGVVAGNYPAIETLNKTPMTGKRFMARVDQILPQSGGNYETYIEAGPDYSNHMGMYTHQWGFEGYLTTGGNRATIQFAYPNYAPASDVWWSLGEAGGVLRWETSPDAVTWTLMATATPTWSVAQNCHLICKCGYWGSPAPPTQVAKYGEARIV